MIFQSLLKIAERKSFKICLAWVFMISITFATMKADDALIDKLAKLSRLEFNAEERLGIKNDLDKMFSFVEQLNELDTEGVTPLVHVNPEKNVFRPDVVNESLTQAQALKNAPQHDTFYFKVPKVVENPDS